MKVTKKKYFSEKSFIIAVIIDDVASTCSIYYKKTEEEPTFSLFTIDANKVNSADDIIDDLDFFIEDMFTELNNSLTGTQKTLLNKELERIGAATIMWWKPFEESVENYYPGKKVLPSKSSELELIIPTFCEIDVVAFIILITVKHNKRVKSGELSRENINVFSALINKVKQNVMFSSSNVTVLTCLNEEVLAVLRKNIAILVQKKTPLLITLDLNALKEVTANVDYSQVEAFAKEETKITAASAVKEITNNLLVKTEENTTVSVEKVSTTPTVEEKTVVNDTVKDTVAPAEEVVKTEHTVKNESVSNDVTANDVSENKEGITASIKPTLLVRAVPYNRVVLDLFSVPAVATQVNKVCREFKVPYYALGGSYNANGTNVLLGYLETNKDKIIADILSLSETGVMFSVNSAWVPYFENLFRICDWDIMYGVQ